MYADCQLKFSKTWQGLTINITSPAGTTHGVVHARDTESGNGDLYYLEPGCGLGYQRESGRIGRMNVPKCDRAMISELAHPLRRVSLDRELPTLESFQGRLCYLRCLSSG